MPTVVADRGLLDSPSYLSNSVEFVNAVARSQEAVTFLSRIDVAEDLREGSLVFVAVQGHHIHPQELTLARYARGSPVEPAVNLLEEETRSALRRISDEDEADRLAGGGA